VSTPQGPAGRGRNTRQALVETVQAHAYTIPTDAPEADGTMAWDHTTLVVVQVTADGLVGTGWTYGSPVIDPLVRQTLASCVVGQDAVNTTSIWTAMVRSLRNIGRPGIGSMALSAVDCALWDLKARLLDIPLHRLLGSARNTVPLYGSGGFTTYDHDQLEAQLRGWVDDDGMRAVKIKIGESWGHHLDRDLARVRETRSIVGDDVQVFVDANGGYTVGQAIRIAKQLDALDVRWFEEPVSSDNLAGLGAVRQHTTADLTAGEYGDSLNYYHRLCQADVLDCLQVDVTRCGGITELLRITAVAAAAQLDVSAHCAPYQHAAPMAAIPNLRHLEYFHDHTRIERLFFDGTAPPTHGELPLHPTSPGNGFTFKPETAQPFLTAGAAA